MRNPAINALWEAIESKVGNNSIGEMQKEMASRGVLTEIPSPTYGYARGGDFHMGIIDGSLVNEWVLGALRGMIYGPKRKKYGGGCAHMPNPIGGCRISHMRAPLAHEVRKRSKIQGLSVGPIGRIADGYSGLAKVDIDRRK